MIVQRYTAERGEDTLDLAVSLEGTGVAALFIDAHVTTICPHGRSFHQHIEAEVECTHRLPKQEMDDVEDAIRGKQEAGVRLGWRTVEQILSRRPDPCEEAGGHGL